MTGTPPPTILPPFAFGAIPPGVLPLKAASCVFDLCQFQSYISIKDQMIRAHLLSEWLVSTGLLGTDIRRVLVVGGGVAGVCTSALIAEHARYAAGPLAVDLVDGRNDLFTAQESCDSRFVSLTQYDWPGAHYDSHSWPNARDIFQAHVMPGPSFRLTVPPAPTRASDLVKQWRADFIAWQGRTRAPLTWRPNTVAALPVAVPAHGPVTVTITPLQGAPPRPETFDLVIMASGFAQETIPKLGGVKIATAFWEHDDYTNPRVSHAGKDFAIVGYGDGALQDFLRLTCDPQLRSASEIVDRIQSAFLAMGVASPVLPSHRPAGSYGMMIVGPGAASLREDWLRLLSHFADVDRQTTLASPWDSDDRRGMADLQADVEWLVDGFARTHPAALVTAIDAVLRSRADALGSITLVAPNAYPSKCYMLNRFLFTLIRWRLVHGPPSWHPRFGSVAEKVDATRLSRVGGRYRLPLTTPIDVDEIVWRAGIGVPKPTSVVDGMRIAIGRQALPFYPPSRFR